MPRAKKENQTKEYGRSDGWCLDCDCTYVVVREEWDAKRRLLSRDIWCQDCGEPACVDGLADF